MGAYIIRRIIYMIPTILLISIISFFVIQAPPGDLMTTMIENMTKKGGEVEEELVAALRVRYGLDQPIYIQYYRWMKGIILHGDFGMSYLQNRPVKEIILARLPFTILITFITAIFTRLIVFPIGVYSAVNQNTIFDYIFTFFAFIGRAIPNFLLALILMFFFYDKFGWSLGGLFSVKYQTTSWSIGKVLDLGRHLILPVIVVGTASTAGGVRTLRGMMLDELGKEYVQTARAKGLPEWKVIWVHPFKVALLPMIATIGWLLPRLVSGAVITSVVLSLPTTGEAMLRALQSQDMYVGGSFVLMLSTLTVIGTLLSDILLAIIDPRIKYQ